MRRRDRMTLHEWLWLSALILSVALTTLLVWPGQGIDSGHIAGCEDPMPAVVVLGMLAALVGVELWLSRYDRPGGGGDG